MSGQLKAFLLRNGYKYSGKSSWTQGHLRYLRELVMNHPAQKVILEESLQSIEAAVERIARLEAHLEQVVAQWDRRPVVEALQCMRGIGFLAATVLTSELGDLTRFEHPRQLMAYLGLVSSERSTGGSRRQGSITKCGKADPFDRYVHIGSPILVGAGMRVCSSSKRRTTTGNRPK